MTSQRRPGLPWLRLAAALWPVVAVLLAAVGIAAVVGDHRRLVALDPVIVPHGWSPQGFARALADVGLSPTGYAIALDVAKAGFLGVFLWVAVSLWRFGRQQPMALYVAYFLVAFAANWEIEPARLPDWARPATHVLDLVAWAAFLNFFLVFPDGRYRPGWFRWIGLGVPLVSAVGTVIGPDVATAPFVLTLLLAVGSQVVRYRRGADEERRQARWLMLGFGTTAALVISLLVGAGLWHPRSGSPQALDLEMIGQAVGQIAFLPIPLAIAVAVTRHGLWQMRSLVTRAALYAALTAGLAVVYVGVVFVLGSRLAAGTQPVLAVLATAVVALMLQPGRTRLQAGINRLLYGTREDPYETLSGLGARLRDRTETGSLLGEVAGSIARAVKAPYVEIRSAGSTDVLVVHGERPAGRDMVTMELLHRGGVVGTLGVVPRAGEATLHSSDEQILRDLALHAGSVLHERVQNRQLSVSRERIVLAREEERRRLRRLLHDDVGATLAAQKLLAGRAAALTSTDPGAAGELLASLEGDLGTAIAKVRALAYELRPPVLDDLGLSAALDALVERVEPPLGVSVRVPDTILALPAAIELALYRIADQALANVVLHAQAATCVVSLDVTERAATLSVTDDGCGLPEGHRAGVGLQSIRERVEELGGQLCVGPAGARGTRLQASLPLMEGP